MSIPPRLPVGPDRDVTSTLADELRGLRKLAYQRRAASFASLRRPVKPEGSPRRPGKPRDRKPVAA